MSASIFSFFAYVRVPVILSLLIRIYPAIGKRGRICMLCGRLIALVYKLIVEHCDRSLSLSLQLENVSPVRQQPARHPARQPSQRGLAKKADKPRVLHTASK